MNYVPPRELVTEFAKRALNRPVSQEAWRAACRVAEVAMIVSRRVVPVERVEQAFTMAMNSEAAVLVDALKYGELLAALDDFGMGKEYPTDSAKLRRVKAAFSEIKSARITPYVPQELIANSIPLPESL